MSRDALCSQERCTAESTDASQVDWESQHDGDPREDAIKGRSRGRIGHRRWTSGWPLGSRRDRRRPWGACPLPSAGGNHPTSVDRTDQSSSSHRARAQATPTWLVMRGPSMEESRREREVGTWRLGANVDVIHDVTEATAAAVAPGAGRRHDCQQRRHDDGDSVMTHKEAQLGARWRRSSDRKTRSHGWIAMCPKTQAQNEAQRPLSKTCAGHDASWTHRGTVTPPQGVARSRQVMPLDPCNRQGEWMKRGGTDNSRSWAGPQRLTQHTAHSARGRGSPKVSACVPHRSTTTTRWRRGPPSPHPEGTRPMPAYTSRPQCQPPSTQCGRTRRPTASGKGRGG